MSAPEQVLQAAAQPQQARQQAPEQLRIRVVESLKRELLNEPAIELTENQGTLTLQVALTGLSPSEFEAQITPGDILIQSERARHESEGTVGVLMSEFDQGRVYRQVTLPVPIEADLAEARYQYGLLTITAPIATQTNDSGSDEVAVDEKKSMSQEQ